MQYTISFNNISENDQLILRLIFSLSEKARGRSHAYCLQEHGAPAHLTIAQLPDDGTCLSDQAQVWLASPNSSRVLPEFTIKTPLIASRVLSVLDRYVASQTSPLELVAIVPSQLDTAVAEDSTTDSEPDFCISEEEASQLAIVDDESLGNPANINTTPVRIETTAPASLIALLPHKPDHVDQTETDAETETVSPLRALVVDDSPSVRKQIELELALFHVEVDYADSVSNAMALLEGNHYDVAFLDVVLPDGDGFGICRHVRATDQDIKVIMLTSKASATDRIKGTMAGCNAYLVKPVGRMTFQNTVCNYLQLREQKKVLHA